jgi:hypothetical protein
MKHSTRSVSNRRFDKIREEILSSPASLSDGFQSHVAAEARKSRQAVSLCLNGKSKSACVEDWICKLWPGWKKSKLAAVALPPSFKAVKHAVA